MNESVTLTLPRLVAGRDLAKQWVADLGPIKDADVSVDFRENAASGSTFCRQLVIEILVRNAAFTLYALQPSEINQRWLIDEATRQGVRSKLVICPRGDAG